MKRQWSFRVLVKFILLQLPLLVFLPLVLLFIRQWVDIPVWLIWGLVALLIIKDIIMFPIVWRSYDQSLPGPGDPASIIGMQGIAKDRLAPTGYIQVRSELWRAEAMEGSSPIEKGKGVRVVGIEGLTLLVQREDKDTTN
jgi:membrane-bound ClpP family serine protease